MPDQRRQLAAIMFTDIAGYTTIMGKDEDRAFEVLKINKEIHIQVIEKYHGTIIKEMGDGILISFNSSVDAVKCGIEIQKECKKQEIPLKIGIHEGDMVFSGEDVLGDGVNVASRLESVTEKGHITISEAIYRNIRNKPGIYTAFVEEKILKNVDDPVKIYEVSDKEIKVDHFRNSRGKFLSSSRTRSYLIIILVITGVFYLIRNYVPRVQKLLKEPASPIVDASIAVLPFSTITNDSSNQYFANGIRSEIISKLGKIDGLKVASKSSSDTYWNSNKRIPQIANELGVASIMEADAEKFNNSIRIRIRLIDGKKDYALWTREYNTEFSSVWGIYAEIADKVASELKLVLTLEQKQLIAKPLFTNMTAYDFLLKAREEMKRYWRGWNQEALNRAEEYYKKAFELDPDSEFAKARYWVQKAVIYLGRNNRITSSYLREDYLDSVIWYVNNATSISSDVIRGPILGEAYYNRGDIDLAINEYQKWVDMYPDARGNLWYLGLLKIFTNDYYNGISMIKKFVKLSEEITGTFGYSRSNFRMGMAYRALGDYEKAEFYVNKAHELGEWCYWTSLYPIYQGKHQEALDLLSSSDCQCGCELQKGEIYLQMKEYKKAVEGFSFVRNWAKDKERKDLFFLGKNREGFALLQLGKNNEGNQLIEEDFENAKRADELNRPDDHDYHLAAIYSIRNETELALKHLKDYENQVIWGDIIAYAIPLEYSQHDILFENLWDYPGYKEFMEEYKEKKAAIRDLLRKLEGSDELD